MFSYAYSIYFGSNHIAKLCEYAHLYMCGEAEEWNLDLTTPLLSLVNNTNRTARWKRGLSISPFWSE